MNKRVDGKLLAKAILDRLEKRVRKLKKKKKFPCLAIFSAGDNPASASYIRQKAKTAKEIGAKLKHFKFKKEMSYQKFAEDLNKVVRDDGFSGVIIQKPLPVSLSHRSLDAFSDDSFSNLSLSRSLIPDFLKFRILERFLEHGRCWRKSCFTHRPPDC